METVRNITVFTGLFLISVATFFLIVLFLSRSCSLPLSIYKYKFLVLLLVSFEEQQQCIMRMCLYGYMACPSRETCFSQICDAFGGEKAIV